MKTAQHWHTTGEEGTIQCDLCPHACSIDEGRSGICGVRGVRQGVLVALAYGHLSSAAVDPIEKKPLYHFHPASSIFSIGGWGCNFRCSFCQNWSISQAVRLETPELTPAETVARAKANRSSGIAYTYNEPLVAFEFVTDTARAAREQGLYNVLVTNGFIQNKAAREILPLIDALNIDVKSMQDDFYRTYCHGRLQPVLDFASLAAEACHVEITNLLIPGLNDNDDHVAALAAWVRDSLGKTTPLHLSAYRPEFKMSVAPTSPATLERAYEICRAHLSYVYMGNVASAHGQDTHCPGCDNRLVARRGYHTAMIGIVDESCARCGRAVDMRL